MKLKTLTTAVLLGVIQLAVARPGLSQTPAPAPARPDLNAQLQQSLCSQNWGRAIQVVDQMRRVAAPQYSSQLLLYRGRLQALVQSRSKVPVETFNCAAANTTATPNTTATNPQP
ncbi:MAG: hypothetical protein KME06_01320 [Kastovskya adunca ATA6-11-RM4]|jgi:hypothetical protein|nr:hypothetical protein [Kastovskya adunca ATA6-11-RM4]